MWDTVYGGLEPHHDITTSLKLAHTPIFQNWSPPGCSGWETSQEGDCELLPTKWNKDNKGAWRMDLPVHIEDTYDDGCEDKIAKNDYQVDTGDRESESSMSVSSN